MLPAGSPGNTAEGEAKRRSGITLTPSTNAPAPRTPLRKSRRLSRASRSRAERFSMRVIVWAIVLVMEGLPPGWKSPKRRRVQGTIVLRIGADGNRKAEISRGEPKPSLNGARIEEGTRREKASGEASKIRIRARSRGPGGDRRAGRGDRRCGRQGGELLGARFGLRHEEVARKDRCPDPAQA